MEKLSPEAEALTRAGRAALKPNEEDRKRVFLALGARLGDFGASGGVSDPGGGSADVPAPVQPRAPGWPAISAAVAGLALGGGVLWQALSGPVVARSPVGVPVSTAAARPVADVPSGAASSTAGEVSAAPPGTGPGASSTPPAASSRRTARDASDSLAQEVAILSRAESALHAGRFAAALGLLAEHEQKFPHGTLTQERIAARVRALCGLGRTSAARAELAQLAPGSLHAERAHEACAATP